MIVPSRAGTCYSVNAVVAGRNAASHPWHSRGLERVVRRSIQHDGALGDAGSPFVHVDEGERAPEGSDAKERHARKHDDPFAQVGAALAQAGVAQQVVRGDADGDDQVLAHHKQVPADEEGHRVGEEEALHRLAVRLHARVELARLARRNQPGDAQQHQRRAQRHVRDDHARRSGRGAEAGEGKGDPVAARAAGHVGEHALHQVGELDRHRAGRPEVGVDLLLELLEPHREERAGEGEEAGRDEGDVPVRAGRHAEEKIVVGRVVPQHHDDHGEPSRQHRQHVLHPVLHPVDQRPAPPLDLGDERLEQRDEERGRDRASAREAEVECGAPARLLHLAARRGPHLRELEEGGVARRPSHHVVHYARHEREPETGSRTLPALGPLHPELGQVLAQPCQRQQHERVEGP
mmetsp:Transcript_46673/g.152829  ORF Transcript_46673/g.152829 Transcript_46673/m.152829 type:complete len:406 (-) Transcript_46673:479-1696(-)